MAIKEGFIKTKHRRKLSDGDYQLESRWTSASTVEMANGNTVETEMTTHDTANNTTAFTSADSTSAPDSTPPALITSGETHKSLFNKLSMAVKNVRWLLSKMGTTDLSGIGDGTVTNAISTLNSNIIKKRECQAFTNSGGGFHIYTETGIYPRNVISVNPVGEHFEYNIEMLDNGFCVVKNINNALVVNISITFMIWYID